MRGSWAYLRRPSMVYRGEGFTHREDVKQDENGDTVLGRIIFAI